MFKQFFDHFIKVYRQFTLLNSIQVKFCKQQNTVTIRKSNVNTRGKKKDETISKTRLSERENTKMIKLVQYEIKKNKYHYDSDLNHIFYSNEKRDLDLISFCYST